MYRNTILFILATTVAGCTLAPHYQPPSMTMPDTWKQSAPAMDTAPAKGWEDFDSKELTAMIDKAMAYNNDLQAALQRISQARASARIAGSGLWPSAELTGNVASANTNPGEGATTSNNSYRAGGNIGYELDLWGRNRSIYGAAKARADATAFDYDALKLVVASDTALTYAGILTLDDRLRVAYDNRKNARDVLDIVQARVDEGSASGLELSQQKASLANTEASIASLKQQQESLQHLLAVLTGEMPQNFDMKAKGLKSITTPKIALVQPSVLLQRRPDIKSAESSLIAANIDIGTARSAFFPSLQLGADTAIAANPATAPAALITTVASSVAMPLFRGGALTGELLRTKARKEELVAQYRGTVLAAFQEVEDALSSLNAAKKRVRSLATATDESRNAYNIARERYDAGAIDFQTLLDTQRTLLQAEDSLTQARLEYISASVNLYKALGGWGEEAKKQS
jgi:NodT family efflux transporter outer membrane factor (OMF) lipoprotein